MIRSSHWKIWLVLFPIIGTCAYGQPAPGGQGGQFFASWSAAAAAFNPSSIGSLAVWFDASDASSITLVETNRISQWSDKSGNARHALQSTAAYRPTYFSSSNSVFFAISSNMMVISTATNIGNNVAGITGYSVATLLTADRYLFHINHAAAPINIRYAMVNPGSGRRGTYASKTNETLTTFISGSASVDTNKVLHVALAHFNGTNIINSINGTATRAAPNWTSSGNSQAVNEKNSVLGNYTDAVPGGFGLHGYVYELLIYQSAHDTATRQKIEGYLAHKWGLTSSLPSDHPYKTVKP